MVAAATRKQPTSRRLQPPRRPKRAKNVRNNPPCFFVHSIVIGLAVPEFGCGFFNSKFKIQDSKFKIQNSRFKIQDLRFKIQNQVCRSAIVVGRGGRRQFLRFNFYEIKDFVTPKCERKNAKIIKKIDRKIWKFEIFGCIFVISK